MPTRTCAIHGEDSRARRHDRGTYCRGCKRERQQWSRNLDTVAKVLRLRGTETERVGTRLVVVDSRRTDA